MQHCPDASRNIARCDANTDTLISHADGHADGQAGSEQNPTAGRSLEGACLVCLGLSSSPCTGQSSQRSETLVGIEKLGLFDQAAAQETGDSRPV